MKLLILLIPFISVTSVLFSQQAGNITWGSSRGLGGAIFQEPIAGARLVTRDGNVLTPNEVVNEYGVIFGEFNGYLDGHAGKEVAIELYTNNGGTAKIYSTNWEPLGLTSAPVPPATNNYTIGSNDNSSTIIIFDNYIGLNIIENGGLFGTGLAFETLMGPLIEPPVINLLNEYILVQNVPFILDASDKVTSEGGTLTYQWYLPDGTPYPDNLGGNTSILNLSGEESNAGLWSLEVTDEGGTTSHNLNLIYKKDTDGDGLNDEDETNIYYTNPNNPDTDEDGLTDFYEVTTYSTNPNLLDTDTDGLSDGVEVSTSLTDPNDSDSDDDGLSDGEELIIYSTNPNSSDSDSDQISDYDELFGNKYFKIITGSFSWAEAKLDAESRGGTLAILDTQEIINAANNFILQQNSWPILWIGATDELVEGEWRWLTGDLVTIFPWGTGEPGGGEQDFMAIWHNNPSMSEPLSWGDWPAGLPYSQGASTGSYLLESIYITDPNDSDSDNDGLSDGDEVNVFFTDPTLSDTSGDGLTDGIIVNSGFDPTVDYSNLLNQRPTQASYDAVVAERDAKLSIEQVKDLRPGSIMIEVSGSQATVQLQMEESSDLQTWEDTGTPATMTIPADTDTKFFRFKMAE